MTRQGSGQHVLVPLDGSAVAEQVIPWAHGLAGKEGAVTFFMAVPDVAPVLEVSGSVADMAEIERTEQAAARQALAEVAARWARPGWTTPHMLIATGSPADAILAAADQAGADLIALASHGRGALGRFAFGSVADRVARGSKLPVLIVHPKGDLPSEPAATDGFGVKRLVVPLDGSAIAREALPVAVKLATALDAPIHLVEAVNPSALLAPAPIGASTYPADLYGALSDEMTGAAMANLKDAQDAIGDAPVRVSRTVMEGPPASAIEADVNPGDVIVMTSHGRSGVTRWLLGSFAERMIRSGIAPVVLVPARDRAKLAQG